MIQNIDWEAERQSFLPLVAKTELRNNHKMVNEIDDCLTNKSAFGFKGDGGFFVLRPYTKKAIPHLTILFAYNEKPGAILKYYSLIETMARDIGARSIRLYTTVEKLSKILSEVGFEVVENDNGIYCWRKIL